MRKNLNVIFILTLLSSVLFSACSGSMPPSSGGTSALNGGSSIEENLSPSTTPYAVLPSQTPEGDISGSVFEKDFGTYSIAEDWFESKELSDGGTFFYLKDGTSLDAPTSNISVSFDENKYSMNDFQSFAQAVDRQLKAQVPSDVTEYYGSGTYTENGYPLITMTIDTDSMRTIQHYIVGDYCFVMVHATDFGDKNIPDVEEAAMTIADSFVWAK